MLHICEAAADFKLGVCFYSVGELKLNLDHVGAAPTVSKVNKATSQMCIAGSFSLKPCGTIVGEVGHLKLEPRNPTIRQPTWI